MPSGSIEEIRCSVAFSSSRTRKPKFAALITMRFLFLIFWHDYGVFYELEHESDLRILGCAHAIHS